MKKTITITSRGEAQRLLCSGEVKELVGSNKVKYAFDSGMGVILSDGGGWAAMLDCPWTFEIEVPAQPMRAVSEMVAELRELLKLRSSTTTRDNAYQLLEDLCDKYEPRPAPEPRDKRRD